MTVARSWAVALQGIEGFLVEVEAGLSSQVPGFDIIGLPDKSLGESASRVRHACAALGLELPRRRLTVNLSPAALPKRGAGFDVAIALAALATEHELDAGSLARTVHIGELGLDGRVRPVRGVLPAVHAAARAGFRSVVVPFANRTEAELVPGIEVRAAVSLADAAAMHGASVEVPELDPVEQAGGGERERGEGDLSEIVGQEHAVEALVTAAAGGHNLLMSGPPGAGKTMLAERLPGILPPLGDAEALEVAAVRSLSGRSVAGLPRIPPFEAPHHTASVASLVGGGSGIVSPGAIARASHGILFIDEAAECSPLALDALRQPLESGRIEIHRLGQQVSFPARFQLVLAMNPCPCGNRGIPGAECSCPPQALRRYAQRISGPLRDRIDIELALRRVSSARGDPASTSAQARERVAEARERAAARLRGTPWRMNARVSGQWLRSGAGRAPRADTESLDEALRRGALTLRSYDRVLRLAWTLADLAGHDAPGREEIGRALHLKKGIGL